MIHFDDWASDFGETITAIELSPEGSGYRVKTRFAKFFNLPELMATFKHGGGHSDGGYAETAGAKGQLPHGGHSAVTSLQQEMVAGACGTSRGVSEPAGVDPRVDNMLRITNDGQEAGAGYAAHQSAGRR